MDELNLHHKHNETDTQERLKKEGNNQVTGRLRMCFCVACQSGTWMDQWLIPGCKHAKWCGELCGKNTTRGDLIQWYSKLMIIIIGPVCCSSLPAAFWNLPHYPTGDNLLEPISLFLIMKQRSGFRSSKQIEADCAELESTFELVKYEQ